MVLHLNQITKFLAITNLVIIGTVFLHLGNTELLSLSTFLINFLLIIETKRFKPLSIFFFFCLLHLFPPLLYFSNGTSISSYTYFAQYAIYEQVLVIHAIMISIVALMMPNIKENIFLKENLMFRNSNWGFWFIMSGMIFITLFTLTGTSILDSSGYGSNDFETQELGGLSIFEYFIVLIPVAYIYTNNNSVKKWALLVICTVYSLKGLLFGGRVEAVQAGLLVFILFFDSRKLAFGKLILIVIVPAYVLVIFGSIRHNPLLLIEDFQTVLLRPFTDPSKILGNQNDIYYSSARLVGLVQNNQLTYWDRVQSFLYNIVAPVVPYGRLPDIANLAAYKKDEYSAGGGGLISVFFWTFLSIPGVVIIGTYLGYLIRNAVKKQSTYFTLYLILGLSTYPRWFGYSPITLFKLCLYVVPFYFLLCHILEPAFKINKNESLIRD